VKEFVIDLFRSVDPRTSERGAREITAHALVDGGLERLRARLGAQPEDRAELLLALSDLYWGLGDTDNALALGREALAIHRELYGSGDLRLLPAIGRIVQGVAASGRSESVGLFSEADALLERAGPAYDDDRLRVLQAHLLHTNRTGDFQASESAAQRILALQERRYGPDAPEVGVGLVALGWAYSWQNRYQDAERLYRRALTVLGPDHNAPAFGSTRDVRFQLGSLAMFQGRYDAAEREFQQALAEATKRLGPDHFYVRSIRQMLALTAFYRGRADEAETVLRALSAEVIKSQGPESQRYPAWPLGRVLAGRGKMDEAVSMLRTMLGWTERASGAQAKFTQFVTRDLGAALIETGELAEAGTLLERAMAELDRIETRESYHYALVEARYARLLLARGDAAGAEARARHAWTVLRESIGEDYDEAARAAHELGRARLALGQVDGVEFLRSAAQNYERHFGRDDVRTAEYRFVLGEALLARQPDEARSMLDQAARALVAAEGNTLPVKARAERWLAGR
jgi:tetratricopeptide (TPR) repeat protein